MVIVGMNGGKIWGMRNDDEERGWIREGVMVLEEK